MVITLLKLVSLGIWIMMMLCLLGPGLRLVHRYRHQGLWQQRGTRNRNRLMGNVNRESRVKLSLVTLTIQA